MRIAFLSAAGLQFSVDTPYEQPLGGSESAICYLAAELANHGHAITIYNGNSTPSENRGIQLRNLSESYSPGNLNAFDVVIVGNAPIARPLRRDSRVSVPLVSWMQHSHTEQAVHEMNRLNERKSWTSFAFVSEWQRANYIKQFWLHPDRCHVMRNAISPAFANRPLNAPWFITGKPPTLFYSSTPFRGLDVLLQAFPTIRAAIPGAQLRIFSSMSVYQVRTEDDPFRELYVRAQQMEGVEYVGAIAQSRLADELAGAAALAYPSTFAETSCITVLEAMASGAAVLTTKFGALPETTNGFASMVDWQPDKDRLAESFSAMTIKALRTMQQEPSAAVARRDECAKYVANNYNWATRAKEWIAWLEQVKRTS